MLCSNTKLQVYKMPPIFIQSVRFQTDASLTSSPLPLAKYDQPDSAKGSPDSNDLPTPRDFLIIPQMLLELENLVESLLVEGRWTALLVDGQHVFHLVRSLSEQRLQGSSCPSIWGKLIRTIFDKEMISYQWIKNLLSI